MADKKTAAVSDGVGFSDGIFGEAASGDNFSDVGILMSEGLGETAAIRGGANFSDGIFSEAGGGGNFSGGGNNCRGLSVFGG